MNNDNKQLSNQDFRNLLGQSNNSNSNNNNNNNNNNSKKQKKKKWIDRDYEYYQTAPEKIDTNYKDRAKERRQNKNEEDYNDTTEGETIIKKGLDFNLLYTTKEQLKQQEHITTKGNDQQQQQQQQLQQQQQQQNQKQKDKERLSKIKCKTDIGKLILEQQLQSLDIKETKLKQQHQQQQQKQQNKEIFQTSRMLYLFDLDPDFPQHIPTTILNSKEDCPKIKQTMDASLDNKILKRIINYYHPNNNLFQKSTENSSNNNIEKDLNGNIFSDSGSDSDSESIKKKTTIKRDIAIKTKDDDDDDDDNIFSDTEEYQCEINNKKTSTTTTTNNNYFGTSKDDYSSEFKPIGREGDENIKSMNVDDENLKIFINKDGELVKKNNEKVQSDNNNINNNNQNNKENDDEYENEDEDDEDEYVYPNTDANYKEHENKQQRFSDIKEDGEVEEDQLNDLLVPPEDKNMRVQVCDRIDEDGSVSNIRKYDNNDDINDEDEEDEDEDEYAYPNTDENYEQHEKDYMKEQDKRFNEVSSESDEEDNIISLDTNNEQLKRKLFGQDSSYGDDYYPEFTGFDRERGEKPKQSIDEMYKIKKTKDQNPRKKSKSENFQLQKINQILKKKAEESGEKFVDILGPKKNKK